MPIDVIVTGSEGLIGTAVCAFLSRNGHRVYTLDLALGHDLSNEEFVREWFRGQRATALVNLFALNDHVDPTRPSGRLMDISLESFRRFLDVNLISLFSVCREFARNNKAASIVNFTSTYGLVSPKPDLYHDDEKHIAYGVSKAGVIQLTRHLAVHLAPRIRVNCIAPGGVRNKQDDSFAKAYAEHTPLGRMMNVSELPPLVEFLIGETSSYCTGAVIRLDGGWTAW
jgi:NAD(P)-dependent dehydrogenase (short-subunit alcohol dehydrogenase family)